MIDLLSYMCFIGFERSDLDLFMLRLVWDYFVNLLQSTVLKFNIFTCIQDYCSMNVYFLFCLLAMGLGKLVDH